MYKITFTDSKHVTHRRDHSIVAWIRDWSTGRSESNRVYGQLLHKGFAEIAGIATIERIAA